MGKELALLNSLSPPYLLTRWAKPASLGAKDGTSTYRVSLNYLACVIIKESIFTSCISNFYDQFFMRINSIRTGCKPIGLYQLIRTCHISLLLKTRCKINTS